MAAPCSQGEESPGFTEKRRRVIPGRSDPTDQCNRKQTAYRGFGYDG